MGSGVTSTTLDGMESEDDVQENIAWMAVLVLALAGSFYILFSRSRRLLDGWAAEHGYELLRADLRPFLKGPFFWSSKGQTVYRVLVRDRQGQERAGWVRCGSWLLGLLSDQVEARWDAET
jgi:hypothetical protein